MTLGSEYILTRNDRYLSERAGWVKDRTKAKKFASVAEAARFFNEMTGEAVDGIKGVMIVEAVK